MSGWVLLIERNGSRAGCSADNKLSGLTREKYIAYPALFAAKIGLKVAGQWGYQMGQIKLPKYSELPVIGPSGDRHSWGIFGEGDQMGTINLLTEERRQRAARLVNKGKVFNLSLPLNQPNPPFADRQSYKHEVYSINRNSLDDKVDNLHLQASSQWDALCHMRYREFGFYGGLQEDAVEAGALGIDRWADHGIVGRGVLLDMGRYMEGKGTPLNYGKDTPFSVSDVKDALDSQGVELEQGDILVLRTGWLGYFLAHSPEDQARFPRHLGEGGLTTPGLVATHDSAEFLWDSGFAAVVADNIAVEDTPGLPERGFLHRRLIPLLGLALGELWWLDELAEDCATDGIYECMLVGIPLNIPGGVGSPANAIAIK